MDIILYAISHVNTQQRRLKTEKKRKKGKKREKCKSHMIL